MASRGALAALLLLLLLLTASAAAAAAAADARRVSVYYDAAEGAWTVREGVWDVDGAVCALSVSDRVETSGWLLVNARSNSRFDDALQSFCVGFAEGYATALRVFQNTVNGFAFTFERAANDTSVPAVLGEWFAENRRWVRAEVAARRGDAYWDAVGAAHEQFEGVVAGYAAAAPALHLPPLDYNQLQVVNSFGDLFSLLVVLGLQEQPDVARFDHARLRRWLGLHGHCSGLVAVTPDFSNIFAAHSSWYRYENTMRVYRLLDLQFRNPRMRARRLTYSSYPATVASNDDFLVAVDTGIVAMETSNNVFNDTYLRVHTTPHSLLNYAPVLVAMWLAGSGAEWAELFTRHNANLYCNQYYVADFSRFTPFEPLQDGLLTVVENIPGLVHWADVTHEGLGHGAWPSFNVPYFRDIYEVSGYPAVSKQHPDATWSYAPRAQLFRRDVHSVTDLASLGKLMRSNHFEDDPLAHGDPGVAIMSRFDLAPNPADREPAGGYDTKLIDYVQWRERGAATIKNGPTSDSQPVFDWELFEAAVGRTFVREGLPVRYDFDWVHPSWDGEHTTSRSLA